MVPSNQVFSAFSFIGFVLVSIPLAWHLESWNTGTCLYMIWTSLSCLSQFINSVVWNNNAINWAPVWCDISSRLIIGASVAIPASSLCISRRLYHIAVMNIVKHKKRELMLELSIGVGLPVLVMVLEYIVQGHRFNIYEEIGCYPAVYDTPAAYPIILIWPVAIGLVSSVYAGLTIRTIIKRKARMDQLFQAHRNINPSIYRRLMALATLEILCTVPLGLYSLIIDASGSNVAPYISWENVHYDFSYVGQIPVVLWQMNPQFVVRVELTRWLLVLCAFAFFAFFGLAKEARKNYSLAFYAVVRVFGYVPSTPSSSVSTRIDAYRHKRFTYSSHERQSILPVYTADPTHSKYGTLPPFLANLSFEESHTLSPHSIDSSPIQTAQSPRLKRLSLPPFSPFSLGPSLRELPYMPFSSSDTPPNLSTMTVTSCRSRGIIPSYHTIDPMMFSQFSSPISSPPPAWDASLVLRRQSEYSPIDLSPKSDQLHVRLN